MKHSARYQAAEELEQKNFTVFSTWLQERYGVSLDWDNDTTKRNGYKLFQVVQTGLNNGNQYEEESPSYLTFIGKDGASYVIRRSQNGDLYVHSMYGFQHPQTERQERGTPSTLGLLANVSELPLLTPPVRRKAIKPKPATEADRLFANIKNACSTLREDQLTVTEEHAVERALQEATTAVSLHSRMEKLESPEKVAESLTLLTELLNDLTKELKRVTSSVSERINFDMRVSKSLVAERNEEGLSL